MSSATSDGSEVSDLAQRVLDRLCVIRERNLEQLYRDTRAESLAQLGRAMWDLINDGLIKTRYRVHTPYGSKAGLEYFDDAEQIPDKLKDRWSDPHRTFNVSPEDIEVLFSRADAVQGGRNKR